MATTRTKHKVVKKKPLNRLAQQAANKARQPAKAVKSVPAVRKAAPVPAVRREANQLAEYAKQIKITNETEYQAANDLAGRIKAFIKARAQRNAPLIEAAKLSLDRIREEAGSQIEGLDGEGSALEHIKHEMDGFEERREVAQKKKSAELLEQRLKDEKLQRRTRAAELIEDGKDAEAKRLLAAPSEVQAPVFSRLTAPGMSKRSLWTWELEDINKVNSEFLTTADGEITKIVRALGDGTEVDKEGHLAQLGNGIRVFKKDSRAFKAAAVAPESELEHVPAGEAIEVEVVAPAQD